MPLGGTQRFPCFLVVMREQTGVLVEPLGFGGGNGFRDGRVSRPPRRVELRGSAPTGPNLSCKYAIVQEEKSGHGERVGRGAGGAALRYAEGT